MLLKAFLDGEMRRARGWVSRPGASEEAVHEARKAIKRLRAGLRLGRRAFSRDEARRADAALRAAGRALSPLRDRRVLEGTVGKLRKDGEKIPALPGSLPSARKRMARARGSLDRAAEALRPLPWKMADAEAVAWGVKRLYRRARRAMGEAAADPSDEALHAWRKRTKDLLYALPVAGPGAPGKPAREIARLAELLGDDHDLACFARSVLARRKGAGILRRRARRQRRKLQEEAFRTGRRVFRRKPRAAFRR